MERRDKLSILLKVANLVKEKPVTINQVASELKTNWTSCRSCLHCLEVLGVVSNILGLYVSKDLVQFKSSPLYFEKERSGEKSNTVRKIDEQDVRFELLRQGCKKIMIIRADRHKVPVYFERIITDYTEFDGYAIISWKGEGVK